MGNRLSALNVPTYSYNNSNELTSSADGNSYTYDFNGNTLTKSNSSGTTRYAWDFENRLSSVTLPNGGGLVGFQYDPFGRRIQKSSSAGTTNYLYDSASSTEELDGSGAILAHYSEGFAVDEPLAMMRSGTTSFYDADGLGSITSLSNASGAAAQTYTFNAFGKQSASSGSLTNSLQFAARDFDVETGMYNNRARYYDVTNGRFLTEDPLGFLGSGANFYAYAAGSPTNFVDPFGLTIGVIGDSQSVSQAIYYLSKDPAMNQMIAEMQLSDTVYTIITTSSNDADFTEVSGDEHTIIWNPHLGLKCSHVNGREYGAVITPALALGHELAHQRHDWKAFFLGHFRSTDYTTLEEWRVIHYYENPAARNLHEGIRSDHFGALQWVATSVTKPECNCQGQRAPQ